MASTSFSPGDFGGDHFLGDNGDYSAAKGKLDSSSSGNASPKRTETASSLLNESESTKFASARETFDSMPSSVSEEEDELFSDDTGEVGQAGSLFDDDRQLLDEEDFLAVDEAELPPNDGFGTCDDTIGMNYALGVSEEISVFGGTDADTLSLSDNATTTSAWSGDAMKKTLSCQSRRTAESALAGSHLSGSAGRALRSLRSMSRMSRALQIVKDFRRRQI